MQGPTWELDYPVARLRQGNSDATVNVLAPERGLTQLQIAGTDQLGSVGQVVFATDQGITCGAPSETYGRGSDLIARYAETHGQPFRAQVYWRSVRTADQPLAQAALDVMVSLETDVSASRPPVTIETTVRVDEVRALDGRVLQPLGTLRLTPPRDCDRQRPQGLLLRCADTGLSLALLARPEDTCDVTAQWDATGGARIVHQLVCEPLEKGVILRRRVRCVWGHDVDLPVASAWHNALLQERLPLTV